MLCHLYDFHSCRTRNRSCRNESALYFLKFILKRFLNRMA